jgi:hypothetical protein
LDCVPLLFVLCAGGHHATWWSYGQWLFSLPCS